MPPAAVKKEAVNEAIFAIANNPLHDVLHGEWVPLKYWGFLVTNQLESNAKIKESKLRVAMEMDAGQEYLPDRDRCGSIVRVRINSKKVRSRRESAADTKSGQKARYFLRVDSAETVSEPDVTENLSENLVTKHFQASYNKYANKVERRSSIGAIWVRNIQPRCVTPETPVMDDANQDIWTLLAEVIDPKYLKKKDLFIGEAPFETLRERIHKLGMQMQKKKNTETYLALSPHDTLAQEIDAKKYEPLFNKFCCPLNKRAIQAVIGTALKIETEHEGIGLFQLSNYGGGSSRSGKRLVTIVPSKTSPGLYKNGKRFLPNFYEALSVDGSLDHYTICYQLMMLHKYHCKQAFDDICLAMGPKSNPKMSPYRQIAMSHTSNMNTEHFRLMTPHLNADGCNPFNSERQMRRLRVSPAIPPIFSTFEDDEARRCHAWFIPADEAVREEVAKEEQANVSNIDEVHVIFSADHGQKAFRCNIGTVGITGREVTMETNRLVGQIDCKKDTYHVLEESRIIAGLNSSLIKLNGSKLRLPGSNREATVKVKATGDLAWYSLGVGKVCMAGNHCWRCNAMWGEFQDDPFYLGEQWTCQSMKDTFNKLESGELKRKDKKQERGLVKPMLLDCIEPEDWIVPVLHAVVLQVNTVFKHLQLWIWYRIEDVAVEVIIARTAYTKAEIAKADCWEVYLECSAHLAAMRAELKELKPAAKQDFDDDDHETDYQMQVELVKAAQEEAAEALAKHALAKADRKAKKKALDTLEKKKEHGKAKQNLWLDIQRMLKDEFNIYVSVYHGGAFEGNQARQLLREAPQAMARVADLLVNHIESLDDEEKKKRADKDEITLFTDGFQRLFQYMDMMAHYCYQPFGSMTDVDVLDAKTSIRRATLLWHKLMPTIPMKVHGWQHLGDDLEKYRGLKSHNDEPIERCHQKGRRENYRLHGVRDFKVKTMNVLINDATVALEEVQAMLKDTQGKIKRRKRKQAPEVELRPYERRSYLRSILLLPLIEHDFPSLLELNMLLHRRSEV